MNESYLLSSKLTSNKWVTELKLLWIKLVVCKLSNLQYQAMLLLIFKLQLNNCTYFSASCPPSPPDSGLSDKSWSINWPQFIKRWVWTVLKLLPIGRMLRVICLGDGSSPGEAKKVLVGALKPVTKFRRNLRWKSLIFLSGVIYGFLNTAATSFIKSTLRFSH